MTILDVEGDISLPVDIDTLGQGLIYRGTLAAALEDGDDRFRLLGFHLMWGEEAEHVRASCAAIDILRCVRYDSTSYVSAQGRMGGWTDGILLTAKPEVAAQVLSPAALMMAALSRWPEPTRLFVVFSC